MKLFVGLGNPGEEYLFTRHNIGFMVIDRIVFTQELDERERFDGIYAKFKFKGEDIIVFKPDTYMNLSGEAVRQIVDYFKIKLEDIIVIYDDMDLPVGTIRLRENGGAGGHNGMKNIIQHLGSENFKRLRIGIGKSTFDEAADYVLGRIPEEEKPLYKQAIVEAANALFEWCFVDFNKVMTKYNKKG